MFCTQCGKQGPGGAVYCAFCGAKMLVPEAARAGNGDRIAREGGTPAPEGGGHRGRWRAAVAVIAAAVVVVVAGHTGPRGLKRLKGGTEARKWSECNANLRQLGLAALMYSADYDDHLPFEETWADGLSPFVKNHGIYKCPSSPGQRCGYAYDPALSGRCSKELASPAEAILLFDAKGGWNQAGTWDIADPRHWGGLNIAFADGSVHWGRRDMIPANSSRCSATSGAPPDETGGEAGPQKASPELQRKMMQAMMRAQSTRGTNQATPPPRRDAPRQAKVGPKRQEPRSGEPHVGDGETANSEGFRVTVPAGWLRHHGKETGSTKLYLTGPEVNGKPLILGVDVYSLEPGMALENFSDGALSKYRDRAWTEDKTGGAVELCGERARRVAFTDSDGDNLFHLCVARGKAYIITMISPAGTMGAQEHTFDQVLGSFDLHSG